jgi:hypothetical protein
VDPIERLLAERDCERLIYEYARRIDLGEADRIADLFVADAVWESSEQRLEGQDAIRAWFTDRGRLTRRVSRHMCVNVVVDVHSLDEASARSYLVNHRFDREEGDLGLPVPAGAPKYVGELYDRFVRTQDGWRFGGRRVELSFVRPRRQRG